MPRGLPIRRRTLGAAALGVAALAACTRTGSNAGSGTSDSGGASAAPTTPPPDPSTAALTASTMIGTVEVTVGVRPLVRHDGRLVLTVDLSAENPDPTLRDDLSSAFDFSWGSGDGRWKGVRLLDLASDRVAVPAMDAEDLVVPGTWHEATENEEGPYIAAVQLMFGDLGVDEVDVYLPKIPLITGIPVLEAEVPVLGPDAVPIDPSEIASAPVVPMVSVSADLLMPIRERADQDSTTVDIGSDVLFDSSSATISAGAGAVLDEAVARIMQHEPGTVTIIGHTDSVDDEEFNLDLSRRRAEAVAEALTSRLDTADYPLETDGRGEAEPVADNGTEEGRARNRRVEIRIATPRTDAEPEAVTATLPPFDGLVATGEEGLLRDDTVRPVHLRTTAARIIEGHLVVSLEAVIQDEEVDTAYGLEGFNHMIAPRDDIQRFNTYAGLAVLTGTTLTLPVLHRHEADGTLWPLTDLYPPSRIDGGVPRVIEMVYPRGIPGIVPGGTLTLQNGDLDFRLTDIPISS